MKDEPHSHRKATVALVAVLLLAYVGSYLWMRQRQTIYTQARTGMRVMAAPKLDKWYTDGKFLNRLYWPLRELDKQIYDKEIRFIQYLKSGSYF